MYPIVYRTENKINGKFYYGVDSNNNPKYLGSGKLLKLAIEKYGRDNFVKRIVRKFRTIEEAYHLESLIVDKDFVDRDDCYNITEGGKIPPKMTKEKAKKISATLSKRFESSELRDNLRKALGTKLIDTKTGKKFDSITQAALEFGIKPRYLMKCINGERTNKTSLRLLIS